MPGTESFQFALLLSLLALDVFLFGTAMFTPPLNLHQNDVSQILILLNFQIADSTRHPYIRMDYN